MNRLVIAALLAALQTRAHAEPTRYLAGGMMFGAAEPVYDGYNVMAGADGGYRLDELWWAHAGVGYGTSVDRFGQHVPNGGRNGLVRGGVEARWCAGTVLCGIAGVDLGVQHGSWTHREYSPTSDAGIMQSYSDTAFVAIPRMGFDVGGDRLRVRVAIEGDMSLLTTQINTDFGPVDTGLGHFIGLELAAGVAYLW